MALDDRPDIEYRVLNDGDIPDIKSLLLESFFQEEPLFRSLKLQMPEECVCIVNDEMCAHILADGLSVGAFDRNLSRLVGVRLSCVQEQGGETLHDIVATFPPDTPGLKKMNKVFSLAAFAESKIDVYDRYDVKKACYFVLVNVDAQYQRRGIARELVLRSMELARSQNLPLVEVACTGIFSQSLFKSLQYDELVEILYNEYKVNDEVVFKADDLGIHKSFQVLAKRL